MKSSTVDSRARRAGPAMGVVVLLHLGLLLALLQARVWPERQPRAELAQPTWLRLLPLTSEAETARQAEVRSQVPSQAPQRTRPAVATTRPAPSDAPPAKPPPAGTTLFVAPESLPAPVPASPPPAAEPTSRLNLSLPRGASAPWRHPALDDPRSNTPPTTLERRLAELMGPSDGPITEEPLADGSLRLRQGSRCVIVRPNRAGALDPFNQSVSAKPRQADRC